MKRRVDLSKAHAFYAIAKGNRLSFTPMLGWTKNSVHRIARMREGQRVVKVYLVVED